MSKATDQGDKLFYETWKQRRVFELDQEQFAVLAKIELPKPTGPHILAAMWPFDAFEIRVRVPDSISILVNTYQRVPSGTIVIARPGLPDDDSVEMTIDVWLNATPFAHAMGYVNQDHLLSLLISETLPEEMRLRLKQSLDVAYSLSAALSHSGSIVLSETATAHVTRQQKRFAQRSGKPVASYRIAIKPGFHLEQCARQAFVGKGIKPGYPRRRHKVRSFFRNRAGRVHFVREFIRGGGKGAGPGYVLERGVAEQALQGQP